MHRLITNLQGFILGSVCRLGFHLKCIQIVELNTKILMKRVGCSVKIFPNFIKACNTANSTNIFWSSTTTSIILFDPSKL